MQSSEVLEKSEQRCKEKYGVNNVSQSDAIKQQKLITTMKNFGKDNLFNRKKAAKTQVNATNAQKEKKLQKYFTKVFSLVPLVLQDYHGVLNLFLELPS